MWSLFKWSIINFPCLYKTNSAETIQVFSFLAKTFKHICFEGFDLSGEQVHSEVCPSEGEEWLLLVDESDQSYWRAVIIKNKHSGRFLAVRNGCFIGLTSYNEDCKWFLE